MKLVINFLSFYRLFSKELIQKYLFAVKIFILTRENSVLEYCASFRINLISMLNNYRYLIFFIINVSSNKNIYYTNTTNIILFGPEKNWWFVLSPRSMDSYYNYSYRRRSYFLDSEQMNNIFLLCLYSFFG